MLGQGTVRRRVLFLLLPLLDLLLLPDLLVLLLQKMCKHVYRRALLQGHDCSSAGGVWAAGHPGQQVSGGWCCLQATGVGQCRIAGYWCAAVMPGMLQMWSDVLLTLCRSAGIQHVAPVHEFPEEKWNAVRGAALGGVGVQQGLVMVVQRLVRVVQR